jgi:peptidoglycan/LPS O-acetylase OafA/YrhL
VYWSLAVEEHFYLAFPWLFLILQRWLPQRNGAQAALLFGLCGLILCWRLALLTLWHVTSNRLFMGSDTRVDSILFGCALALFGNPMFDDWRGSRTLWCWLLLPLGLAMLAFTFIFRAEWFREATRYSLQGLALIPVFVAAIRYPEWGPMRVLNWRVVRRVGVLSYSLYLCHQVILFGLVNVFPSTGRFVISLVALGLSLAIAELIQRFVEKPSGRARRRFVTTAWLKPPRVRPATH